MEGEKKLLNRVLLNQCGHSVASTLSTNLLETAGRSFVQKKKKKLRQYRKITFWEIVSCLWTCEQVMMA